jgi:hypothetical protein
MHDRGQDPGTRLAETARERLMRLFAVGAAVAGLGLATSSCGSEVASSATPETTTTSIPYKGDTIPRVIVLPEHTDKREPDAAKSDPLRPRPHNVIVRPETPTTTIPNEAHLTHPVTLTPEQAAHLPEIAVIPGSAFREYLSGQSDPSTVGGPWPAPNNPWRTPYIEKEPLNGRTAHVVAHRLSSIDSATASADQFEDQLNEGPVWDNLTKFFGKPGVTIVASHDVTEIVNHPITIWGKEYNEVGAGYNNDAIRQGDELQIWLTTPEGGSRVYIYKNIVDPRLASLPTPNVVDATDANYALIQEMPPNVDSKSNVLQIYMCWPQWNKPQRRIFTYELTKVELYPTARTSIPS